MRAMADFDDHRTHFAVKSIEYDLDRTPPSSPPIYKVKIHRSGRCSWLIGPPANS